MAAIWLRWRSDTRGTYRNGKCSASLNISLRNGASMSSVTFINYVIGDGWALSLIWTDLSKHAWMSSNQELTWLLWEGWGLRRWDGGGLGSLQLGGFHLRMLRHLQLRRLNLWCLNLWGLDLWGLKFGCWGLWRFCLWLTRCASIRACMHACMSEPTYLVMGMLCG